MDALGEYFDAMRNHHWERLARCLSSDVRRVGPYLDVVEGREAYVDFLAKVLPTLPNYSLSISSIDTFGTASAVVRLTETLDVGGVSTQFPEVLLFEFDDDGRIRAVDVYVKQVPGGRDRAEPGETPSGASGSARSR